jgi:hypothetical protein
MKTVFDAITRFNEAGTDLSRKTDSLKYLFDCSDFDQRHGKRVYANWLERCCSESYLNTLLAEHPSALDDITNGIGDPGRLLDFVVDLANRQRNQYFVMKGCNTYLREFMDLRSEVAPGILPVLNFVSKQAETWSRRDRQYVGLMFMRLCLTSLYLHQESARTEVQQFCRTNSHVFAYLPESYILLLKAAVLGKSCQLSGSNISNAESATIVDSISEFVPSRLQMLFGMSRSVRKRTSGTPSNPTPVDLFFVAQYIVHKRIVCGELVTQFNSVCKSSFDETLVFHGLVSDLLFNNAQQAEAAQFLINGLGDENLLQRSFYIRVI